MSHWNVGITSSRFHNWQERQGEGILGGRSFSSDISAEEAKGASAPEEQMGRLKHRTVSGFTYFVTTKTWRNRALFQVPGNAEILSQCILRYRDSGAYLLHEFVIMPNHLHLLITPADDTSIERAIQLIKGGSSHEIHLAREHKIQIWQPGFHEESVRDLADYHLKAAYIHNNPVHAGLAQKAEDWPYGSAAGKFTMDGPPERLKICSSGAEAPQFATAGMSELKLRPPKLLS